MTALDIGSLKDFISKLPDDFCVEYHDKDGISHVVVDKLEVDLSGKMLILKS